jgi:plastocyanin
MLRLGVLTLALAALGCRSEGEGPARDEGATSGSRALAAVSGRVPRATGGFASVVTLAPADPSDAEPPPVDPSEPPVMDQFGIAFHPRVLLARAGDRVVFRNGEDVLHNVHVRSRVSGETIFNVATLPYREYAHPFDAPGVYDVSCDTHPAMAAFVVVTAAAYATVASADGSFELAGVPEGRYRVAVWNLDPDRCLEREVAIAGPSAELDLAPAR